jgi:hypothetical protein
MHAPDDNMHIGDFRLGAKAVAALLQPCAEG